MLKPSRSTLNRRTVAIGAGCTLLLCGVVAARAQAPAAPTSAVLHDPREVHLADIRQLTFGGENAEAYWAEDGLKLTFQSTRPPYACDQIFSLPAAGGAPSLLSTGAGKTTCAYFYPDGKRFLYASTHLAAAACPAPPDRSKGYVWALDGTYEIFARNTDGGELAQLTKNEAYDAEATICPIDGSIVFTSDRDGDLELYRMDADGQNVVRLTTAPGYDGGAFFSRDCKQIVYRASRPTGADLEDYKRLLGEHLVRPSKLEIWVADMTPEGARDARQVTNLDAASFAPYFFPDGDRILFSTNYGDPKGREFDIWAIDVDGSDLERITYFASFDGFPMFSPDGKQLVFASNRNQGKPGETDVYIARWIEAPPVASELRAEDRYAADVAWLADDARDGRGVGTAGNEAAAAYIEERFRALGLEPAGNDGGYRQEFDVTVSLTSGPTTALTLDGTAAAADAFAPLSFSKSATATGGIVFAGYGIVARDKNRDDYAGLDVKGKIVLVRRFVPPGETFKDADERRYSDLRYKAFTAREHGAAGLLVVDLPELAPGATMPDEAPFPKLSAEQAGDAGLVIAAVKREVAQALLTGNHEANLVVELLAEHKPSTNVVGRLKSTNAQVRPGVVVLGAHFDHLGHGGANSMAPGSEEIHNGADDNASGTAALLESARLLAGRRADLAQDLLFIGFSGEERGLLGSTAMTRNPPAGLDLKTVRAMINMDMVGRLRDNKLAILGGGSAEEWPALAEPLCAARKLLCTTSGDGYGPSDQTPFYAAGIPILHLFTGAHDDYHRPSDDSGRINATGGATVAALAADLAIAAAAAEKLTLRAVPDPAPRGDVRSFGASLGTIPDYAGPGEGKRGVLLSGVRPGGAAEKAGIRRGDILIGLLGRDIGDINDFMFLLQQAKPGDKAKAIVLRAGKRIEFEVVFGESKRM
jgi:Tol biopolymer transport system component